MPGTDLRMAFTWSNLCRKKEIHIFKETRIDLHVVTMTMVRTTHTRTRASTHTHTDRVNFSLLPPSLSTCPPLNTQMHRFWFMLIVIVTNNKKSKHSKSGDLQPSPPPIHTLATQCMVLTSPLLYPLGKTAIIPFRKISVVKECTRSMSSKRLISQGPT